MKLAIAITFIGLCLRQTNVVENCDVFSNTTKNIDTIIVKAKYNSINMLPGRAINPANSTIIPGDLLLEELEKNKLLKLNDFRADIIFSPEGCNTSYSLPFGTRNKESIKIAVNEKVLLTCVVFKNIKSYPDEPPVVVIKVQKIQ